MPCPRTSCPNHSPAVRGGCKIFPGKLWHKCRLAASYKPTKKIPQK